MTRQPRVFLSYTAEDLSAHAEAAGKIARSSGWVPIDHRYWAPSGRLSVEECKEQIQTCEALIVLVAHRYGWVPTVDEGGDGQKSITWIEVDHARSLGMEVIPFVLKEGSRWPTDHLETIGNVRTFKRLQQFKKELGRRFGGFFTENPESIEGLVAVALQRLRLSTSRYSRPAKENRSRTRASTRSSRPATYAIERDAFTNILEHCLGVPVGGDLLIVHDESIDHFLPALIDAICTRNLRPTMIRLPIKYQLAMLKQAGSRPSSSVIGMPFGLSTVFDAMEYIVTFLDSDMATTAVRHELLSFNRTVTSRLLHVPGLDAEILKIVAKSNMQKLQSDTTKLARLLAAARNVELITYDDRQNLQKLTVSLSSDSVRVFENSGAIAPGEWGNLALGSASVIVDADCVTGSVSIDGSVPGLVLGGSEHLVLTFEAGRLTNVLGQNRLMKSFFDEASAFALQKHDDQWNRFGELSIGTNSAIEALVGNPLLDTKLRGAAAIGIGNNSVRRGGNRSYMRADLITLHPTVTLDGIKVVNAGSITG